MESLINEGDSHRPPFFSYSKTFKQSVGYIYVQADTSKLGFEVEKGVLIDSDYKAHRLKKHS